MRTFEYRLYPNKEQHHLLMACLAESRGIYNGMLSMLKEQYNEHGTFPSKYDLANTFKGQGEHVPATTMQMLADRLHKALKRFLAASENERSHTSGTHPLEGDGLVKRLPQGNS